MNARRSPPTTDLSPWYALCGYLVEAYSNPEMRRLVEISLLPEAGSRLPDERVPAQEYAFALCTLIQRLSGVPSQAFWQRLLDDRPLRRLQVTRLRAAFTAYANEARPPAPMDDGLRTWLKRAAQAVVITVLAALASTTVYCVGQPSGETKPPPKHTIECKDGTPSPKCEEPGPGCCSHHGGVR